MKALITGLTGQDGAYLAKNLLEKGYKVFGGVRRISTPNFWRLEELKILNHPNLKIIDLDITDLSSCIRALNDCKPTELYNLAAQSFVAASFKQPLQTIEASGTSAINLLESIRITGVNCKFYQASTSEMFGSVVEVPQNEDTPFYPRSPYGFAKLMAHWGTINYRESYDFFASSGILFNHESPLRGIEFITRKITDGVAKIIKGKNDCLEIGNLDAKRDWGDAEDYVEGMRLILSAEKSDTFVLATGETHSIRDFLVKAFSCVDIKLVFEGTDLNEIGIDKKTNKTLVKINPKFYRPAEVDLLIGDPSKAKNVLGWKASTNIDKLVQKMINADLKRQS